MKRHDLLEKKVEKAESILSAKAEAKETVQREVHVYRHVHVHNVILSMILIHTALYSINNNLAI